MSTVQQEPAHWLDAREARAWRGFMTMQGQVRRRVAQQLQREAGLSEADYEVLVHLSEADGGRMRAVELGAATQWEKSRLFHQITRMHARGLVTKESCGNARHAHVALTENGRAVIEAAAPNHVEFVRRAFVDALSADQLDALAGIAEAVVEHLRGTDDGCCDAD
ncbi:MAG: MarR family transcriptional regulator [Ilumatobacteraceae bacterium]|nr:MarR family transcriptional regulator [Ilumatobacteraceae bacterium]MCU1386716.1 MarR family transcriptional regulator [Ilumatobacteraceae bacterium]